MKAWLKKLFEQWFSAKVIKAPVEPAKPVATDPVKPVVLNDDPSCDIILKQDGKEPKNTGQVTYEKRVLTARPYDGHTCICLQFNDASVADGERTVFKNEMRNGIVVETLPVDIPINKIVVWYNS